MTTPINDTIIIRPLLSEKLHRVTSWLVVRERDGKRPQVLVRVAGNGELCRRLAVKAAVFAAQELLIEDLVIEPTHWANSMAGHVRRLHITETERATQ